MKTILRPFALCLPLLVAGCSATQQVPTLSPEHSMIIADVRISIRPDAEAQFSSASGAFLAESRAAQGNLDFQLLSVAGEPHRYILLERWESMEAFDAYLTSDAFAMFRTEVGPLLAGPPESHYYAAAPADREVVQ